MDPQKQRMVVHHIGGRNGTRAFPQLTKFESDIINVMYDADSDCVKHITEQNKARGSAESYSLPYCIGGENRPANFHINYDPRTSSLLEPNQECSSLYFFHTDHDYLYTDVTELVEKRQVDVRTMDKIFIESQNTIPGPSFLSIDAQGMAYDILKSATETLCKYSVALCIESEFRPLYANQKLFGDICSIASANGFDFVTFTFLHDQSPTRKGIGQRAAGFTICGDALFFRKIKDIKQRVKKEKQGLLLCHLAFIAIAYRRIEFAFECIQQIEVANFLTKADIFGNPILSFIYETKEALAKMPNVLPISYGQRFSLEDSKERLEGYAKTKNGRYLANASTREYLNTARQDLEFLKNSDYTDLEKVFLKYYFKDLAEEIKSERISQSTAILDIPQSI